MLAGAKKVLSVTPEQIHDAVWNTKGLSAKEKDELENTLPCPALPCLSCVALRCVALRCVVLHFVALRCVACYARTFPPLTFRSLTPD